MRSASRLAWFALVAACGLLLLGAVSGCATTQDTAAAKQAESKRILQAREQKQRSRAREQKRRHHD